MKMLQNRTVYVIYTLFLIRMLRTSLFVWKACQLEKWLETTRPVILNPGCPTGEFDLSRAGVANKSIAIDRSIAECQLVDRVWFYIQVTRYLKRTLFNQYSRNKVGSIKIIDQLVGHVYSLVPLAMADYRLARQMPRQMLWYVFLLLRNNHDLGVTDAFAFYLCIIY